MNKDRIKRVLSGIGIAGLVASVGITMGACKKGSSSCGKGSCSGKDKAGTEEVKSGSCGKGSCGGTKGEEKKKEGSSCGKGSCGAGEKKTEEKK